VLTSSLQRQLQLQIEPQVHDFFSYIYRTSQMECDCVVTSLFYIERLLVESAGQLRMCRTNWRSVTLSGMILASKVWDDLSMWSVDFARVS
jgi:Cyclin